MQNKIRHYSFVIFLLLMVSNISFPLTTCNHTYASSPSYAPYDFDKDGIKDEYCFKDSGNCECSGVSGKCYGCWRDLKPPFIQNLKICYNNSNEEVCNNLNINNPVFVLPEATDKTIDIKWQTDENAKCILRYLYDLKGNNTNLSIANSDVKVVALPDLNSGDYSKDFSYSLNLSAPIRFTIDCFDKDTVEGPNYPPDVETDNSCNILSDITTVETCKYKDEKGPILVLDKDTYDYIIMKITDPTSSLIYNNIYYYEGRLYEGLNLLVTSSIYKKIDDNLICQKEGNYSLNVSFVELPIHSIISKTYLWYVNWDTEQYCKASCVGKYVVWNIINSLNQCCGDDSGEYPIFRQCLSGVCMTNTSDIACCNQEYDCVYNKKCYPDNYKGDIDNDGIEEVCIKGIWYPNTNLKINNFNINTNNLKYDQILTINFSISADSGDIFKNIKINIYSNGKKRDFLLINYYGNNLLTTERNITLPIFTKKYIFNINSNIPTNIVASLFLPETYTNLFFITDNNTGKIYLYKIGSLSNGKIVDLNLLSPKNLSLIFYTPLFVPGDYNSVFDNNLNNDDFYYYQFITSNNYLSYSYPLKSIKVICQDDNSVVPIKKEGNNVLFLKSCSSYLVLSQYYIEGSTEKLNYNPNDYYLFN
ncbi:MAG: hypothetical protein ABGW69_02760 [Nanoarchaeota archaeon]